MEISNQYYCTIVNGKIKEFKLEYSQNGYKVSLVSHYINKAISFKLKLEKDGKNLVDKTYKDMEDAKNYFFDYKNNIESDTVLIKDNTKITKLIKGNK